MLIPFRVQCALDGVCGVALARSVHHHLGKRIRQACGRTQRAPRSHFGLRLRRETREQQEHLKQLKSEKLSLIQRIVFFSSSLHCNALR